VIAVVGHDVIHVLFPRIGTELTREIVDATGREVCETERFSLVVQPLER
jgi:hypothetical protein